MKKITKYKSNDGTEFDTKKEAVAHDRFCRKVSAVMAPLGEVPEEVGEGKGWVQHDPEVVNKAKDAILEICRSLGLHEKYPAFNSRGRDCHPLSIIGRVLDDYGGPLANAWSRFCRIDLRGREHQQCYFAYTAGPDASHVCLEDRRKNKS